MAIVEIKVLAVAVDPLVAHRPSTPVRRRYRGLPQHVEKLPAPSCQREARLANTPFARVLRDPMDPSDSGTVTFECRDAIVGCHLVLRLARQPSALPLCPCAADGRVI